jgi:DNA-binding NtrC family response regulator
VPALAEFAVDSPLFSRASNEDAEGVSFRSPSSRPQEGGTDAVLVLLVGCGPELQSHLRHRLAPHWDLRQAASGAAALSMLEQDQGDMVLVAPSLPDLDAVEFQQLVKAQFPAVQVLSLEGFTSAPRQEASSPGHLLHLQRSSVPANSSPLSQDSALRVPGTDSGRTDWHGIVGAAPAIERVCRTAALVARKDTTVLILGESGTGKDLLARAIHNAGPRARQPFVVINCAAIPESLLEAELFGYTKGAFTGASQSRTGRVHAAHGGTLFLDEIGDMPLVLQSKILRFLEQGEVQRIGSSDVFKVDCRILAATNADLTEQVKARQFREDLFYRLAVMPISVPPLRERIADLPALCAGFLQRFCPGSVLHPAALALLTQHAWPGNIRELRNVMERASLFADGRQEILAEDIVL